ncbi:hypothetical protein ACTXT7_013635 [Hymenolepis weldensis]
MIKSPKCYSRCNHIRVIPILVCRPKQSGLLDDKFRGLEEIGLTKSTSLSNGIVSKVVAKNADEAALPYHQDLICPQNNVPWFHIALSSCWTYPRNLISYPGGFIFKVARRVSVLSSKEEWIERKTIWAHMTSLLFGILKLWGPGAITGQTFTPE